MSSQRIVYLKRLCSVAVALGALQFAVLGGAAMWHYAGGTEWNKTAPRYCFWTNTFSDLSCNVTQAGRNNSTSAMLYRTTMVLLVVSFVPLWFLLPGLIPNLPRTGRIMQVLGLFAIAGMVAVPLTPSDTLNYAHMVAIGVASAPALAATAMFLIGAFVDPLCPRWLAWATTVLAAVSLVHFGQYAYHFWGGGAWTPACPAMQKIFAIYVLAWLVAVSVRFWRAAGQQQPQR